MAFGGVVSGVLFRKPSMPKEFGGRMLELEPLEAMSQSSPTALEVSEVLGQMTREELWEHCWEAVHVMKRRFCAMNNLAYTDVWCCATTAFDFAIQTIALLEKGAEFSPLCKRFILAQISYAWNHEESETWKRWNPKEVSE